MKKAALILLIILAGVPSFSQEVLIDSINQKSFTGIYKFGDMGQFTIIPYFSTNKARKKNFIIKQVNSEILNEENSTELELPGDYSLKCITFNGMGYLLVMTDGAGKEDIMMSVGEGNVLKKKSWKHVEGRKYISIPTMGEDYPLMVIDKNGDYYIESFSKELESKWKKTFNAPKGVSYDIISTRTGMDGLEILRKENRQGGKYSFVTEVVRTHDGEIAHTVSINNDSVKAYPCFSAEKDGLKIDGGYFYRDGVYTGKPDGVYIAQLQSDGTVYQLLTVPYSQVVEDVKKTLGETMTNPNSTVIFTTGMVSHETQEYVMTGQVINKKQLENGAEISMKEFVTIRFSFEGQYTGAIVTKNDGRTINLTGDVSKVNINDLGVWVKNAGLLQLKSYAFLPASTPVVMYYDYDGGGNGENICFKNTVTPVKDTIPPICMPLKNIIKKDKKYAFAGIASPQYPVHEYGHIPHSVNHSAAYFYEFEGSIFRISKKEYPILEQIRNMPEPPHHEEPKQADGE